MKASTRSHFSLRHVLISIIGLTLLTGFAGCRNPTTDSSASSNKDTETATVVVGSQSGTIVAACGGTATFTAKTSSVSNGAKGTISWYSDSSGTTERSAPTGISIALGAVSSDSASITITGDSTALAGTYYFKATIDGTASSVSKLTITTWVASVLPTTTNTLWQSVAYGNGVFVALSIDYTVAYSSDGISWTKASLPSTSRAAYQTIAYGNGKFVVMALNSRNVLYSSDGINWTMVATADSPAMLNWTSVAYGNGKFVALAYDSFRVAYSSDGITWTTTSSTSGVLPSAAGWRSITYGDDRFVAIASDNSGLAAYSSDGITWTGSTMPSTAGYWSVAYGNGKFVAVAANDGADDDGDSELAAYSSDGITWTGSTLSANVGWDSVAFGNGKFAAIAGSAGDSVTVTYSAFSSDGITWNSASLPSEASWQSVTYGNGKFVAISGLSTAAAYLPW